MNRLLLLSVTLAFIATACTSKCTIKGEASLNQLSGKTIYLKFLDNNATWVTLDSAKIIHGSFVLDYPHVKSPKLVTLFMDCVPLTPVVLEPGNVNISITSSDLLIHGTPLNDRLYSFYKDNQEIERKIRDQSQQLCTDDFYESVTQAHQALIKNFMLSNRNNILGPTVYSIYHSQYPELFQSGELEMLMNTTSTLFDADVKHQTAAMNRFDELEGFLYW